MGPGSLGPQFQQCVNAETSGRGTSLDSHFLSIYSSRKVLWCSVLLLFQINSFSGV